MTGFPLLADLRGRRVLVVGAGRVAARRIQSLLAAGALVEVVAAEQRAELPAAVALTTRPFAPDDVIGAWLVIAATDDPSTQRAIAVACETRQILCVRADDASEGTARIPAVARDGELVVAVNGGDDPRRAVAVRDAISVALATGGLPDRPTRAAAKGSVALVGGGPGDPDLITVRGRRLLAAADVVVADRLAPRELLTDLPATVEVVDAGKSAHRHNLTQDEINALIVDRARAGLRVVRLKGGDPFVFGRGGEEVLACLTAGVEVTVVPGISAALAAPAAAGIPVTHRGVAAEVVIASAHLDPGRPVDGGLDWAAMGGGAATLVLLMGMDRLDLIAKELIRHGRDPRTPAAVVHKASMMGEQVVRAPLEELPGAVGRAGIGAPAVVVIGSVVDVLQNGPASGEGSA